MFGIQELFGTSKKSRAEEVLLLPSPHLPWNLTRLPRVPFMDLGYGLGLRELWVQISLGRV